MEVIPVFHHCFRPVKSASLPQILFHKREKTHRWNSLTFRSEYPVGHLIHFVPALVKQKSRLYFNAKTGGGYSVQEGSDMPVIPQVIGGTAKKGNGRRWYYMYLFSAEIGDFYLHKFHFVVIGGDKIGNLRPDFNPPVFPGHFMPKKTGRQFHFFRAVIL